MKTGLLGLMVTMWCISCKIKSTRFSSISPKDSNITFVNDVTEYDTFNILNTEFIYNGAGVAVGDLDGDGLEDLYFSGNQVQNKCYLNQGNFKFKDITDSAYVQKNPGQWSSGVNIIDINGDGRRDIYVCNTLIKKPEARKNLLFINLGNIHGIPRFREMASDYGISDTSYSSHAQFFDYDRDGDLDLFIGTNYIDRPVPGQFIKGPNADCDQNCDKLYRNDWDSTLHHPVFKDVSGQSGMSFNGYSHSTLIYDFNEDGWQDIYVANDYLSDDILYINNHDGTFSNKVSKIFRHQASSAMGSDLGDINNDGKMDLMTVEMLPFTNLRKKTLQGNTNYSSYLYIKQYGYQYQYSRNTLQFNEGFRTDDQLPIYSDISFLSGVHETEWSWGPLFADYDLDGYDDLYITNGFPKDVTDRDFGEYRKDASNLLSDKELQDLIPVVKVSNFMFQNNKDLTFKDVTKDWGLSIKSFSNGVAYGDLDGDGDEDLIVQNIDDAPFLFKNNVIHGNNKAPLKHYLKIKLVGSPMNADAIGAKVKIYGKDNTVQTRSTLAGRGYLSQSSNIIHFGLDTLDGIDSVVVFWPEGIRQTFGSYKADQTITLSKADSGMPNYSFAQQVNELFQPVSPAALHLDYKHDEKDFIDFNIQKTIPHKMSQYGVPMAVGDINGDGTEDLILGGSAKHEEIIFTQNAKGSFDKQSIMLKSPDELEAEDAAMALFDVDGDHDQDLIFAGGSYENFNADKRAYCLRLFINDGKGHFTRDTVSLSRSIRTCASTLRIADIDLDGDQDIFVGGHVMPASYPRHDPSFILINQSGQGRFRFEDKTKEWAPELNNIGIINDGIWSDYNNDGKPDLVLAIEWGPVTILKNKGNVLSKINLPALQNTTGWWGSLTSGDFNCDGRMDYVAGNYGQNVYFKCNADEPITIYAKDFDQNGSLDPFISCYWRDTMGNKKEYFFNGRDEMIKQLITIRRKFQKYTAYGLATVHEVFSDEELKGAMIMKADNLSSMVLYNLGGDQFKMRELPEMAQLAPMYGMMAQDVNEDGYLDLITSGNDYGLELTQGRADAMQGLVMINDQAGYFKPLSFQQSGYFVLGDAKSAVNMNISGADHYIFNMVNLDSLVIHKINTADKKYIQIQSDEYAGNILFENGSQQRIEFYPGTTYKSQSPVRLVMPPHAKEIQLENAVTKTVRSLRN
jgi:hypothetical protein